MKRIYHCLALVLVSVFTTILLMLPAAGIAVKAAEMNEWTENDPEFLEFFTRYYEFKEIKDEFYLSRIIYPWNDEERERLMAEEPVHHENLRIFSLELENDEYAVIAEYGYQNSEGNMDFDLKAMLAFRDEYGNLMIVAESDTEHDAVQKMQEILTEDRTQALILEILEEYQEKMSVTETETETEPETQFQTETEPETQFQSETYTETETEVPFIFETDYDTELELQTETETDTQRQIETEPETQRQIETEPETQRQIETEPETQRQIETEPETQRQIETEPETQRQIETEPETQPQTEVRDPRLEYIFPDSNSRYLSDNEILALSLQAMNYAKNEIYARRGRKFVSIELQQYFASKSWYHGYIEPGAFDPTVFNDYERVNAERISSLEKQKAGNDDGYPLDTAGYDINAVGTASYAADGMQPYTNTSGGQYRDPSGEVAAG